MSDEKNKDEGEDWKIYETLCEKNPSEVKLENKITNFSFDEEMKLNKLANYD